jgi:hypothetical protein
MKKLAPLVACAVVLLVPATSHAATNFGSRLNHDPANSGECQSFPQPCTIVSFIHPSDPNGDPYSGGAPVSGVITKFRIRGFGIGPTDPVDTKVTFRVAHFVQATSGSNNAVATAAGTGPTVTVKAPPASATDVPIQEFPGRVSVSKGDHLAIDGTNIAATVNNSGQKFSYLFTPPLVQGQGPRGSTDNTGELLVAATIEPDSDHDGFGDETQDKCPTEANGGAACSTPDRKAALLSVLRFRPPSFFSAPAGPSVLLRTFGSTISYRLSETATTTFTVQRVLTGRRIRGRCRSATKRNKLVSRRKCKLYKRVRGSFKHTGGAGANSIRFTGRVGGKRLKAGSYRLVAATVDPAGNRSKTVRTGFRIKR